MTFELASDTRAVLGECPTWDPTTGRMLWIDHPSQRVLAIVPSSSTQQATTWSLPGRPGCIALRQGGGWVVALPDGIWALDPNDEDAAARMLAPLPGAGPGIHLNDGAVDAAGRLWVGSVVDRGAVPDGVLWRLEPGGSLEPVVEGLRMSNGLDWSPDGRTLYLVDSGTRRVDAFRFDVRDGSLRDRRTLIDLEREAVLPDGLAVDAEGGIWLALWDGWSVRRYAPDGRPDRTIELPVAQVTSCTFGGPDLDVLFVTTAADGLTAEDLAAQPLAGSLFRARPAVRGREANRFGG